MNKGIKTPRYVIELAKDLKHRMTKAEEKLWSAINKRQLNGLKFRRQHPVYRYVLDFFCHEKQLAIEVDGGVHEKQKDNDDYRDEFFKSAGISTIRIRNEEIMNDLNAVIKRIKDELHKGDPSGG